MSDLARRVTVFAAVFAVLALLPAALPAEEEPKEQPPEGGTPKDFYLPEKRTTRLDNGLDVTAVRFGSVPKTTVVVVLRVGNLNDGDKTWLADLAGDFLLEGTHTRSAEDIARDAAAMGGAVNVSVGENLTTIGGDVLADFAPQMIELLADVVRNPRFPESELERLRRDRLRQLSVASTQPDQMAHAGFREALYGDHPYGRMFPAEEQLAGYNLADIRGFYEENFGARRTHVFVSGMFDEEAVLAAIERAFGTWKSGAEPLEYLPDPAQGKVEVEIIDRPEASQSNIYLGLSAIDPSHDDWIRLELTNTLLGGSFASRITRNIREDKGYTYSPFSTLSARRGDGYWAQVAAVTTDVTGPALEEIYAEIERLREEPPAEDELDGMKNYRAGVFVLQNSTRRGIVNVLSFLDLHELPETWLGEYVSNVFAVSPEDISETARRYLRPEDMTLVVVGDRSQVAEQLPARD